MGYAFLADLIVTVHVAYVGFVVVGQALILLGLALKWQWVRNPWFRTIHLIAIGLVAAEGLLNLPCPLTTWEFDLRGLAGQPISNASFFGRLFHNILFYDNVADIEWVFTWSHIAFGALVLATFALAPPRWRKLPATARVQDHAGTAWSRAG